MSRRHTLAVQARIQADPAVVVKTYIAIAPKDSNGKLPATPYVVIYPGNGTDSSDRLAGPNVTLNPSFTLHVVGSSWDQAAQLTERIKALFVAGGRGTPPVIEGENTSGLRWSEPLPVQIDRDVTPPVAYQVVELDFTAEPS